MVIRLATKEDAPAIIALLDETGLRNPRLAYTDFSHPTLVADDEGRIAGMIQGLIGYPYGVITEIAVATDEQSKGVGTGLLAALESIFRECECEGWSACTAVSNPSLPGILHRFHDITPVPGLIFMRTFS